MLPYVCFAANNSVAVGNEQDTGNFTKDASDEWLNPNVDNNPSSAGSDFQ